MPYTTEVVQSTPFTTTPVGQKLIAGISNDLCVANEQNVKFCFEIIIAFNNSLTAPSPLNINLGVFKTTPNNAGVGLLDISSILQNYVSSDNLATDDSDFKINGSNGRPIPIHFIDFYSRTSNAFKYFKVDGYTEYTDSSGVVQTTSPVNVMLSSIINCYVKETDLLEWTDSTYTGNAFGFSYNLEPFAIKTGEQRKFLSNSPSTLFAKEGDYGTLSYLGQSSFPPTSGTFTDDVSYYKVSMFDSSDSSLGTYDIDRTTARGAYDGTVNVGGDGQNRILYLGSFPANLKVKTEFNTQLSSGNLAYYTIGLYDVSNSLISEEKKINLLCPNLKGYESIRITWLNQYGTWDYYTFDKKSVKKITAQESTYQQSDGTWNSTYYEPYGYKGGKKTFRVNAKENVTVNTDYISEEHSDWFEELVNSPEVYILKDWQSPRQRTSPYTSGSFRDDMMNQYVTPVRVSSRGFTKKTIANDKLIQYTFEVEKSRTLNTQTI